MWDVLTDTKAACSLTFSLHVCFDPFVLSCGAISSPLQYITLHSFIDTIYNDVYILLFFYTFNIIYWVKYILGYQRSPAEVRDAIHAIRRNLDLAENMANRRATIKIIIDNALCAHTLPFKVVTWGCIYYIL